MSTKETEALARALYRTLYDADISFVSADLIPRLTATVRACGWRPPVGVPSTEETEALDKAIWWAVLEECQGHKGDDPHAVTWARGGDRNDVPVLCDRCARLIRTLQELVAAARPPVGVPATELATSPEHANKTPETLHVGSVGVPTQDERERIARVLHADDVKHGRAFDDFWQMNEDTAGWYFDNADAVLSAIRGHAPTQDEREALADVIFDGYAKGGHERAALDVLAVGFRRQVCSVTETDVDVAERAVSNVLRRLVGRVDWAEDDTAIGGMAAHIVRAALEAVEAKRKEETT